MVDEATAKYLQVESYREKILEVEKELDLETFTYKGIGIWPVIRLSIILSRPKTNKTKGSFIQKMKFLATGLIEFFKWKLGLWPKSENIFLTSSHYKVKEKGVWHDRIIDPFLSWLNANGKDYIVFEFTNNFSYKKLNYSNRSVHVQPLIYLLSFIWKLEYMVTDRKPVITGDVGLFNELTKREDLNLRINASFYRRLFILEKQSKFFEKILLNMSAKHVGMVCYYDFKSLALTWASNRLKIPSIDFQHGVQHKLHLSYSKWPKAISHNSVFIPSHFYVWNEYSFNNIAQWHGEDNIIIGGNKWIQDRITTSERNIILYTVQPLDDPIPVEIVEAIKNYSGEKRIFIRLHPQQLDEYAEIENYLKKHDIFHKVNIEEATYNSLTDILANSAIHLTKSSSVAIEASYFDIPTVFIDNLGRIMYESMIPANHFFYADTSDKILDYLYKLEDLPARNMHKLPLDNFENIRNFYNNKWS